MGTLSTVIEKVRLRIRENKTQFFVDNDFMSLANDSMDLFSSALMDVECKLAANDTSFSVVSTTADYAIADKSFIVPGYIFLDGAPIPKYSPLNPEQLSYLDTVLGLTLYNHAAGDMVVYYWPVITEFTAVSDTIPYDGVWDQALMRSLVVESKEIRKHNPQNVASLATQAYIAALAKSIAKYGTFERSMKGSLNVQ